MTAHLDQLKIDVLLVSSPANVRYLSDYTGSNGLMLIARGETHFFTDPRYGLEASEAITGHVHVAKGPLATAAAGVAKRKKWKKIGIEAEWLTVAAQARFKDQLPLGFSLAPVGRIIEEQRMIKSPGEIDKIRRSVNLNSEAFGRTMRRVRVGTRENEIAAEMEFQMRALGAEKPSFDTIVAVGERSALPHSTPTGRRLAENELLLIDMGASLEGYDVRKIGLRPPRATLYARINARVISMIEQGWMDEVRDLIARGIPADAKPFQFIGYSELRARLQGRLTEREAVGQIQQATLRLAKRQITWFRKELAVQWLTGFGDDPAVMTAALTLAQTSDPSRLDARGQFE